MGVSIEDYNPSWADEFAAIKAHLTQVLEGVPTEDIVHVGSTSIPGLRAKPVIDIDIIVLGENVTAARAALSAAGYHDLGELGIPQRYAFKQPGVRPKEWRAGIPEPSADSPWRDPTKVVQSPHNLGRNTYVVVKGSMALRNHLDLKRMLLSDPELLQKYGRLKSDLAHLDIDDYCIAKTELIGQILAKAGWSDEELRVLAEQQ